MTQIFTQKVIKIKHKKKTVAKSTPMEPQIEPSLARRGTTLSESAVNCMGFIVNETSERVREIEPHV